MDYKKVISVIKKLLCCALFIPSFTLFAAENPLEAKIQFGYEYAYLHNSYAGYRNTDWMRHLQNNTPVYQLSLPGSHHSLSRFGGEVPQTQTLTPASQLEMGIRYYDVKFKYRDGLLQAYHGAVNQHSTFDEFLSIVSQFLAANPSEMVLIRVQNEAGASNKEKAFFDRFRTVRDKYLQQNYIPTNNDFTLGQARGKYIFIQDINTKENIGLEKTSLFIQNHYKLATNWDLYSKWQKVKAHFEALQSKNQISLNYLSGSVGSYPYFVASGKSSQNTTAPQLLTGAVTTKQNKWPDFPRTACADSLCSILFMGINKLAMDWIGKNPTKKLGIVVADFPGGALVNAVIKQNITFVDEAK